jgi:hypothetical protein
MRMITGGLAESRAVRRCRTNDVPNYAPLQKWDKYFPTLEVSLLLLTKHFDGSIQNYSNN